MLLSEWSDFQLNFGLHLPALGRADDGHTETQPWLIAALGFALIRRGSREGKSTVGPRLSRATNK